MGSAADPSRTSSAWLRGCRINCAKYRLRSRKPPSQTWKSFLQNHARQIAAIDFFTVPTVTFDILYGFVVLLHDRRQVVHSNVTTHPTALWAAQ
jgi:putative transposase